MPVKVEGNVGSGTYLLLLPGGPAGDGLVNSRLFPDFTRSLAARYGVVYYDQRGSGNCRGVYDTSSLSIDQLVADLDRVVQTLRVRDPEARIFLMGYSFGGTLGMHFLRKHQQKIAGFISIAGTFDRAEQADHQLRLIEYMLQQWVANGELATYEAMKTGYSCTGADDVADCRRDSLVTVRAVEAKLATLESYNQISLSDGVLWRLLGYAFFSQSNPITSGLMEGQSGQYFEGEFGRQMITDWADAIDLPVLLINGRYDTNVPFFEARDLYERLGTPVAQKELVILEQSGHLPMLTEPEELARRIISFVEGG